MIVDYNDTEFTRKTCCTLEEAYAFLLEQMKTKHVYVDHITKDTNGISIGFRAVRYATNGSD